MTDLLLGELGRLGDAPEALDRVRQLSLGLALTGRLTRQEPSDGQALDALKALKPSESQAHRRVSGSSAVAPQDGWSGRDLPTNWATVRLGEAAEIIMGQSPPGSTYNKFGEGVPLINGPVEFTPGPFGVTVINQYTTAPTQLCRRGDLLLCVRGSTTGRTNIAGFEACLGRGVAAVRALLVDRYIWLFVWHQRQAIISMGRGIAFPSVTRKQLEDLVLPLPPVPEQHRIVAKVDKLVSICDELEAAQVKREARRDRLRMTSFKSLVASDNGALRSAASFFVANSARMITKPEHVEGLRRTILDLAMRGRLVPQDPMDGNGQDTVNRLQRAHRVARTVLQVRGPLPRVPNSWAWATIDQIAADEAGAITDGPFGANLKTSHYIGRPGFRVIRLENIGRGVFRDSRTTYISREHWERLIRHHVFAGDIVVAGLVDPAVRACELPPDIGPAVVKADCYRLHVHPDFIARFALYYLNSPICQEFASVHHHGMTLTRLGLGNFRGLPIPVPPFEEQRRIVATVGQLMILCDELAAKLTAVDMARRRSLEAVVHEAVG